MHPPDFVNEPSALPLTDGELVRRAREGERRAFDELIERHQPIAHSLATRIVGEREWGLELTQEAVLHAYLSLDRLREPSSFRAWLCGIVVNLCKNQLRRPRVDTLSLELLSGGRSFDSLPFSVKAPQPDEVAQARETHRLVLDAVAQLSAANREAVLLYYFEQLSVREVASILHISEVAVKGRLHKSRGQLRARLRSTFPKMLRGESLVRQPRSMQMIPVSVFDVIIPDPEKDHRILVLMDEKRRRLLAIWIGPYEADNIALNLREIKGSRPMTYSLMADLLDKAGVQIESVAVSALENECFYATIEARNGENAFPVDARPSDAIALALHTRSPIFVAEAVMDAVGEEIPEDLEVAERGQGLGEVLNAGRPSVSREEQEAWQSKSPEQRREENRKKLLAYLTEAGSLNQSAETSQE